MANKKYLQSMINNNESADKCSGDHYHPKTGTEYCKNRFECQMWKMYNIDIKLGVSLREMKLLRYQYIDDFRKCKKFKSNKK